MVSQNAPAAAAAAALFLLAAVSFGIPSLPLLPPGIGAPEGPLPCGIMAGPLVPGAGTCNCCCLRLNNTKNHVSTYDLFALF